MSLEECHKQSQPWFLPKSAIFAKYFVFFKVGKKIATHMFLAT